MAAAKKKPIKTCASSGTITNLKQSLLETFDIYGIANNQQNIVISFHQDFVANMHNDFVTGLPDKGPILSAQPFQGQV
jgi:hypothetical protein